MIKIYVLEDEHLVEEQHASGIIKFDNAAWIDIANPTQEEEWLIENHFGIAIPNITEIDDIEVSRRLYSENETHYLTAYILSSGEAEHFQSNSVRFILLNSVLITVRYVEIGSFTEIQNLIVQQSKYSSEQVLLCLLKSAMYHFADILEQIGFNIDLQTKSILNPKADANIKNDFRIILQNIGRNGDATSKAREGLISINRLITYIIQDQDFSDILKDQMAILAKDINALNDHTFFLSNQINFLLEATLGMINIEQNIAIKVFSVASMMFLPPTLIASAYGMNFAHIPGLHWKYGYIIVMILMIVSSYLPYKYFRKRGWF